jgi:hypothetical protein
MFIRHRHGPTDKLDCSHAMGTDAFSLEWSSESFRHILLFTTAPFDTFAALSRSEQAPFAYHRREPSNLRIGLGAGAA